MSMLRNITLLTVTVCWIHEVDAAIKAAKVACPARSHEIRNTSQDRLDDQAVTPH